MKNLHDKIFTLILLFITSTSSATVEVSGYLNLGVKISSQGKKSKRIGTMDCNPGGSVLTKDIVSNISEGPIQINNIWNFSSSKSINSSQELSGNIAESIFTPRKLSLALKIEQTESLEDKVSINLNEVFSSRISNKHGDQCDTTEWISLGSEETTTGNIRISYKVPKNTWLVRINRIALDGDFGLDQDQIRKLEGDIVPEISYAQDQRNTFVWVKPESILTQVIPLNIHSKGNGLNGNLMITFKPIGTNNTPNYDLMKRIASKRQSMELLSSEQLMEWSLALLFSKEKTTNEFNQMPLEERLTLLKQIQSIAYRIDENPLFWHSKAAMSFLLLELSDSFLSQYDKLCTINYKDDQNDHSLNLIKISRSYWGKINTLMMQTQFELYEVLLSSIKDLGQKNMTGKMLMENHDELEKISKAYTLAKPMSKPFSKSLEYALKIDPLLQSTFLANDSTKLINILKEASDEEKNFIANYKAQLTNLKKSNSILNVDLLLQTLPKLSKFQVEVKKILFKHKSIIQNSDETLQNDILDIYSSAYNILANPVEGTLFERIRIEYNKDRIRSNYNFYDCFLK